MERIQCLLVKHFGVYVVFELETGEKVFASKDYKKVCKWVQSPHQIYYVINNSICDNKKREE